MDDRTPSALDACRLCGKTAAYPGAIYCGSACCARWEAGERPRPEDQKPASMLVESLYHRLGDVSGDDAIVVVSIGGLHYAVHDAVEESGRMVLTIGPKVSRV